MKLLTISIILGLVMLLFSASLIAQVPAHENVVAEEFVSDEVIVTTAFPVAWNTKDATTNFISMFPIGSKVVGCADSESIYCIQNEALACEGIYYGKVFLVKLPDTIAEAVVANSKTYQFDLNGVQVSKNHIGHFYSSAPVTFNDPLFLSSQNTMNFNPTAIGLGYKYDGWSHTMGYVPKNTNKVIIGHLDTGIDTLHEDVKNAYLRGYNYVANNYNINDDTGHGSITFGIIAARNNNGKGICGRITDTLSVLVEKIGWPSASITEFGTTSAYNAAVAAGARVFNMAFGFTYYPTTLMSAIHIADSAYKVINIAAVGNTGVLATRYPASGANVITVGNCDLYGNVHYSSTWSDSLDILALGVSPSSIIDTGTSRYTTGGYIGSSYSAAAITGFAWLLKKIDTTWTSAQIGQMIRSLGNHYPKFNQQTGYGYITRMDYLLAKLFLPDTVNTYAACSGKYKLPQSHYFTILDSLKYGNAVINSAISNDSVNTNLLLPGTYQLNFAYRSAPTITPGQYYRDTIKFKIIITGTGGTIPSTTISTANTTVCYNTPFTVNSAGNTSAALKRWYCNGVYQASGNSYVQSGLGAGTYSIYAIADLSTTGTCWTKAYDTSATLTITVQGNTPDVVNIVANSGTTICAGSSATFTASATYGGISPTYQWKVNGVNVGASSNNYTYVPANGDSIQCVVTTSLLPCGFPASVISNAIYMTVTPLSIPSVSIVSSMGNNVCSGIAVTYTPNPTNGGTSPTYQWKKNGVNAAVGSTYTYYPANGDSIKCIMTTNVACPTSATAISNSITMAVTTSVTPTVSISAVQGNPVCNGTNTQYIASVANGGSSAIRQWKVNGLNVGSNTTSYFYVPANGDSVRCVLTSNAVCATANVVSSNTINMGVTPTIVPTISITTNTGTTICTGTTVTYTANITNCGTTPVYQWKKNGSNAGTNNSSYTYIPANGDSIRCIVTSNAACASPSTANSNMVNMSVITVGPPTSVNSSLINSSGFTIAWTAPASGATSYTVDLSTSAAFTAIVATSGNISLTSYAFNGLNPNTIYYARVRANNSICSSNYVIIGPVSTTCNVVSPVIISDRVSVCNSSTIGATLSGNNAATYTWSPTSGLYADAGLTVPYTGGNISVVYAFPTTATKYVVTGTSSFGCIGKDSVQISVTGVPVPNIPVASTSPLCFGGTTTLTETASYSNVTAGNYTVTSIAYIPTDTTGFTTVQSITNNNQASSAIPIPFTFNFYGNSYYNIYAASNGYIGFVNNGLTNAGPYTFPTNHTQNVISLFQKSLAYTSGSSNIKYGTLGIAPNRRFVIDYSNFLNASGSGANNGQVILYEGTNIIDIVLRTVTISASQPKATVGVNNYNGTLASTPTARNNASFNVNNEAWRFYPLNFTYVWNQTIGSGTILSNTSNPASITPSTSGANIYQVVVTDPIGQCSSTNTQKTIWVSNPVATINGNSMICYTGSSIISFVGTKNAIVHYTKNGIAQPTVNLNSFGTASINTGTLSNNSTSPFNYVYKIVQVDSGSCSNIVPNSIGDSVVVTVMPYLSATISGGTIYYNTSTSVVFNGTPNSIVAYHSGSEPIQHIALNNNGTASVSTGNLVANTTYTIDSIEGNGCYYQGAVIAMVTVVPKFTDAIITNPSNNCFNTATNLYFSGPVNGIVHYTRNGVTQQNVALNSLGTATVSSGILPPGNYIYQVIGVDSDIYSAIINNGDTSNLIVNSPFSVALGNDTTICNQNAGITIHLTGGPANGIVKIHSSNGSHRTVLLDTLGNADLQTNPLVATITYFLDSVISNGCSNVATASKTVTVGPLITGSIIGSSSVCYNTGADIYFTGPPNDTLTYSINGSNYQTINLDTTGYAIINTGALISPVVYKLIGFSSTPCSPGFTDSVLITLTPDRWTGTISNDWYDTSNWCGGIPTATTPILIPSGTTYIPNVPGSTTITAENLSVDSAASITLSTGSILDVSGNIKLNGNVTGAGKIVMSGTTLQTICGKGTVSNLTINNTMGVNIDSSGGDSLKVTGVLTLTSGQLTTNDALTLVSTPVNTGSIGTIGGGTIVGNVELQRYIPGGRRCYRFISHPYSSPISLNPELTSNIDITGIGGATNGFTTTQTNNPSVYWYNPLLGNPHVTGNTIDPGWTAFTSANDINGINAWYPYEGIRVLIRGSKGQGLLGGSYLPNPVTIHTLGNVNTGDISVVLKVGASSSSNLVGNPYPSAVNLRPIMYAASQAEQITGKVYWVWDAEAGSSNSPGAYVPQPISNSSLDDYYLPSGGVFIVNASFNNATITFHETDKVSIGDGMEFRTTSTVAGRVEFRIYSNNDSTYWDRLFTVFNGQATPMVDSMDGGKATNPTLNFYAISAEGKQLSMDALPFVNNMSIPLGFKTLDQQQYKIKVHAMDIPSNYSLYLVDNYLNTVQPLQPGTEYSFAVTADSLSQGEGRFQLNGSIVTPTGVTTPTTTTASATHFTVNISPNPATDMTNISFEGAEKGSTAQITISNVNGQEVYSVNVKDVTSGKVSVPLQNLSSGIYMVKVTCGTETITKQLVKK